MHIGVLSEGFVSWGGGIGFIENLLVGLVAVPDKISRITVFVPTDSSPLIQMRRFASRVKRAILHPAQGIRNLTGATQESPLWQRAVVQLRSIVPDVIEYDGSRARLFRLARELDVDVLLPAMSPLKRTAIPWAGYLYDCQHKHYPEFFSAREIAQRDYAFETMLRDASVVVVNARSVVTDLKNFYPGGRAKLLALPFSPLVRDGYLKEVLSLTQPVKAKFSTGDRYFIICNQFWIHKDHRTAFQAFARIAHEPACREFKLICTGMTEDYRFPGYFDELVTLIKSLGISDRVLFTGYISKLEQLALLNGSTAMVQPTLFEGGPGGGATFDAVALGIPSLLSDIPVNLEISDPLVRFFKTSNAESLAEKMMEIPANPPIRRNDVFLQEKSDHYARELGLSLCELANAACV